MDELHFDALTRRFTMGLSRRGLGLLTMLGVGGSVTSDLAAAKKKHKKKKRCPPCKTRKKGKCKGTLADGTACPGGTCQDGACQPGDPCPGEQLCQGECIPTDQCCTKEDCPAIANYRCCNGLCTDEKLEAGRSCTAPSQCCSDYCRPSIVFGNSTSYTCDATCRGKPCTTEGGCCRGFSCEPTSIQDFRCGGCGQQADTCGSDADCCFCDCTARPGQNFKQCLSYPGGPCEKDIDCRSCFLFEYQDCRVMVDGNPVGICQNGVCGCPYECCADFECEPNEICDVDDQGLRGECKPIVGP